MYHFTKCVIFVLIIIPQFSFSANILFFHLIGTSSHRTAIWPLAEQLADRGHNVTYIFPMAAKRVGSHPNITEIVPTKMLPILQHYVGDFDINIRLNHTVTQWTSQIFAKSVDLCEAFYTSPEIQDWLAKPETKFDLILIDGSLGECAYGLVYKFKAKHVTFYSYGFPMYAYDAFGIVPETSSIPDLFFHHKPKRLVNSVFSRVATTFSVYLWRLGILDYMRKVYPIIQQTFPENEIPNLLEFERNTSLALLNSHFVEDYPQSMPPMVQSMSGLWCSKSKLEQRKSLPKAMEDFVNDIKSDGFVYVSFGSSVETFHFPEKLRNEFLQTFRVFPKLKFLWRWQGDVGNITDLPDNLLLKSWFPQHDVLAHGKIKAFISQVGRPSTQEALCHGVPIIGIPLFGDQDYNADRMEMIGGAILLDIDYVTKETLKQALNSVMLTDGYRKRAKQLSVMFRDRPIDPLDNAVYWTEYVMKHNTDLMKPLGGLQSWWQRRLLDVYALLCVFVVGILATLVVTLRCFITLLLFKMKKEKTE